MTLVYARKFDDAMYCIAETSSMIPLRQIYLQPFEEPLFKVLPVSGKLAFAYAGLTSFVDQIPFLDRPSADELIQCCSEVAIHAAGEVEFVVLDGERWRMLSIDESGARECDAKMLGESSAKERLTSERLSPSIEQAISGSLIGLTEDASAETNNRYCEDLGAFFRVLNCNEKTYRGLATPFLMTRKHGAYRHYSKTDRAPLEPAELVPGVPAKLNFNDFYNGGLSLSFCGGADWLAYHLFQPGLGMFVQITREGILGRQYRGIHQHKFIELGRDLIGYDFPMTKIS